MTDTPTPSVTEALDVWQRYLTELREGGVSHSKIDTAPHYLIGVVAALAPAVLVEAVTATRRHHAHVCADEVVEEGTTPAPNGSFTVTERCGICGRVVGTHVDSVL